MCFLLLLLFLFMLYVSPAVLVPSLEAIHPAQLVGAGAMATFALQKAMSRERWRFVKPESFLMVGLLAAAALSSLDAFWPRLAAETTLDLAKIAVIYFLIVNCVDTERRLSLATAALVAGGVFPAAGSLWNYATGHVVDGTRAGWMGTFGNPNDLAYSLVILVPLAYQLSRNVRGMLRPILWMVLALYTAAVFATHSRSGLVGLVAVLVLLGLKQSAPSQKVLAICGVAAVAIFTAFFWTRDVGFANLDRDFTVHQRLETIQTGLRMFVDHPLLGVGLGCSIVAWPLYVANDIDFKTPLVTHNTVVQALSELGSLGFIFFILLLSGAFIRARQLSRSSPGSARDSIPQYAVVLEVSLWGYLICGLSGGYVVSWLPYIIMGLISALTILRERQRDSHAIGI